MKRLTHWIESFNEVIGLAVALALFMLLPVQIWLYLDPKAGSFDLGVLNNIPLAAVYFISASFMAYWGGRLNFGPIHKRYISFFENEPANQTVYSPNQLPLCVILWLSVYFLYFSLALWLIARIFSQIPG